MLSCGWLVFVGQSEVAASTTRKCSPPKLIKVPKLRNFILFPSFFLFLFLFLFFFFKLLDNRKENRREGARQLCGFSLTVSLTQQHTTKASSQACGAKNEIKLFFHLFSILFIFLKLVSLHFYPILS